MSALERIELENFRSFESASFELSKRTAVIGNNGTGKSNLIEAIRLLSVGKSFKSSRLDDAIRFDSLFFRLKAVEGGEQRRLLELFYGQQFEYSASRERRLSVDGKEAAWAEYWGSFPTVLFIPSDIDIVIGPPQIRRRYLDGLLWQTSREFRQAHTELSRVLRERSALLFLIKINRAAPDELSPWNDLLNRLTETIRRYRTGYIEFLQSHLASSAPVFVGQAAVRIEYQTNQLTPAESYKDEVRLSQNLVGPHRDELEIIFNDRSARRFTSRGQARAIVVMLKVAETAFLERETKRSPTVLLDDMFSELDQSISERLFSLFHQSDQLIATSIGVNGLVKDWTKISLG